MMKRFEEGCLYCAKCDGETNAVVNIIKRTEHYATVEYWGEQKTVAIEEKINRENEFCEYLFILWDGVFASDRKWGCRKIIKLDD